VIFDPFSLERGVGRDNKRRKGQRGSSLGSRGG